jgi:uncharacterized membrane protein YdjX (TVP38/TMEM64 family)
MEPEAPMPARGGGWLRLWPVFLVLAALGAAYAAGLHRLLSFEALGRQQVALREAVAANPLSSPLIYAVVYAAATALSLPGAVVITLAGGLLFGTLLGGAAAAVGATAGAILLFLVTRYALGAWLAGRAGGWLARIRPGLERDGFSYLLALRLIPIFPFWIVNLAPALAGMPLRSFALATLIGILPGTFVFASVGAGLGAVLAEGRQPDLSIILRAPVLLPLIGLALLALLPVAWRRWKARHG